MTDDIRDNDAIEGVKPKRGRKAKSDHSESAKAQSVETGVGVEVVSEAERVIEEAIADSVEEIRAEALAAATPESVYLIRDLRNDAIVRVTLSREAAEAFIGPAPGYTIDSYAVDSPPGVRLTRWYSANIDIETGNFFRIPARDSEPNYEAGEGTRILGPYLGTHGTRYIRVDSSTSYDHAVDLARLARERALRGENLDGR